MNKPVKQPDASQDLVEELRTEVERLTREKESLDRQVYRLRLEKDVIAKVAEIIKKTRASV